MNEKQIPANTCVFAAKLELQERSSESAKTAPFRAIARTGDPIKHSFWGNVVHDLSGMQNKPRIPIDFNHNVSDIIGYANRFNTDDGDLEIKGALTPYKDSDRATEVLAKSEMGVPWEASINFAGDMEVEEIPEGRDVTVNGRELSGPLTVIRKWQLRGVAVTPYGYDSGTSTEFSKDDFVTCTVVTKEIEMADDAVKEDIVDAEVTELASETVEAPPLDSSETDDPKVLVDPAVDEHQEEGPKVELAKQFQELFGHVQGSVYFADGLSMEDAMRQEFQRLREENKSLKEQIAKQSDGMEDCIEFSAGKGDSNLLTELPTDIVVPDTMKADDWPYKP